MTYLISQNINIHGIFPIHFSHCPGFVGFLCVASLTYEPYKYSSHKPVSPTIMLSLDHQNHNMAYEAIFVTRGGVAVVSWCSDVPSRCVIIVVRHRRDGVSGGGGVLPPRPRSWVLPLDSQRWWKGKEA